MAVAAATGGTRAPAVREEVSARPLGGGGWMVEKAEGGDFERGSVVEVVVVEVAGGEEEKEEKKEEEEEDAQSRGGKGGKG